MRLVPYEAAIGLEVHVQLRTKTKMFCRCPHRFGAEPNTLVCPICLGYPGTLPTLNLRAVELAVKVALALGARVERRSGFDRKSYFYPDLPKGYQITQYRQPLATGGRLPLSLHSRRISLERLHLEEDAGKLLHDAPGGEELPGKSLVDFNRSGAPLVEIVSRPEMTTPDEARDYVQTLQRVLRFTETSDANMEEGSLRCDANISVREAGSTSLGTRVEIKNLSSVRHLGHALTHEIERQTERLETGLAVAHETRAFDVAAGRTRPLRDKEESRDYRYFPEPDLPPLTISEERIQEIRSTLPELPWSLRERLERAYGLPASSAEPLTRARDLSAYFESVVEEGKIDPEEAASWILNQLLGELNHQGDGLSKAPPPRRLAALLGLIADGTISARAGKEVLTEMWDSQEEPAAVVERKGLFQIRDQARLQRWIDEVLAHYPEEAERYRRGEERLLGFLIGRVMDRSAGRAAPQMVRSLLRQSLAQNVTSSASSTSPTCSS